MLPHVKPVAQSTLWVLIKRPVPESLLSNAQLDVIAQVTTELVPPANQATSTKWSMENVMLAPVDVLPAQELEPQPTLTVQLVPILNTSSTEEQLVSPALHVQA